MREMLHFFRLLKGHLAAFFGAILLMACGTTCYLLLPPQLGKLIAAISALKPHDPENLANTLPWIVNVSILLFAAAIFLLSQAMIMTLISEKIMNTLRERFFLKMLTRRLDESKIKPSGEIASEFFSDLAIIQDGVATRVMALVRYSIFSAGGLVALMVIDYRMTGFAIASIGIVVLVMLVLIRALNKSILKIQKARADLVSMLLESATNAYVIRSYGQIGYMAEKFRARLASATKIIRRHGMLFATVSPISLMVFSIILSFALLFGIAEVTRGQLEVSALVTYFTYALVLISSFSQLSMTFGQLRQSAVMAGKHGAAIADAALAALAEVSHNDAVSQEPLSLRACDVMFTYAGADAVALRNVSMTIPAGDVTAIMGESGSGKSTLAALLCGVFLPTEGQILIGRPDRWTPLRAIDQRIAIVPQEPFLFAGTFHENIGFGRSGLDRGDIEAAARQTGMHDFILAQTGGYDASIGEAGLNLSRGQRQRIAIARAIVGRPSILILDEATASLDVISETIIERLVASLRGAVTVVIIAHKGSILDTAQRRIRIDRGIVVAEEAPDADAACADCAPEKVDSVGVGG